MFKVPVIVIGMVVGYVIGAILIAFGVAVLYEIFSGSSTGLQIVYYPAAGTILLIIGGGVCYGVYESGKSKKRVPDTDSRSS